MRRVLIGSGEGMTVAFATRGRIVDMSERGSHYESHAQAWGSTRENIADLAIWDL